jgi:hypothetical protein
MLDQVEGLPRWVHGETDERYLNETNDTWDGVKREVISQIRRRTWRESPEGADIVMEIERFLKEAFTLPIATKGESQQVILRDPKILQEARFAFETIQRLFLAKPTTELFEKLLDDGRPWLESNSSGNADELQRDIQQTCKLMESLPAPGFKDGTIVVDPGGSEQVPNVTVCFRVPGAAGFSGGPPRGITYSQDGVLLVVLKRIDGKWYWNPFGW